jgi:hypothetical protein
VTKYRVLPAAAANGILTALDAPGRAARTRGIPGAAIAPLSPGTWAGVGPPPISWTLPTGALYEVGGSRVAIVATNAFADGRPEFSGALDALPEDWSDDV